MKIDYCNNIPHLGFSEQIVSQAATHLSWLDIHEKQPGIRVAKYLTELPDKQLLCQKLHAEMLLKRNHFDNQTPDNNQYEQ
jgi:hypothetical protein